MGHILASSGAHAPPSAGVTWLFAGLLALTVLALALEEKIHAKKSVITGVSAIVCLLLGAVMGVLPFGPVVNVFHESLTLPVFIPAIDWEVIAIIFGASLFVDVTAKSGLFSFIAIKLTKQSGGDPRKLLMFYGVMTVVFSAVLNNVTAMLIVGSLSAVSLDKIERSDKLLGFLLIEGLLTNVGGLLTLISSVPNIIIGNAAGIGFVRFFLVSAPFVAVATTITLLLGARLFQIPSLTTAEEQTAAKHQVEGFDEGDAIESRGFFAFAALMFALFIVGLATASLIPFVRDLGMAYVALAFATVMVVRYKSSVDRLYKALDWDLLLFFASLFIVINVMEHALVLQAIGGALRGVIGLGPKTGAGALLAASAAASSVTDNIPLAAVLGKILSGMPEELATEGMWWSVVFGANLGGNLTPIGSASTVVAVTVMHKHGISIGFGRFVRLAVPFAIAQIILAVIYVVLFVG
ncbi:MAG: SLC13 family permease [Polyangiaceae bacterium]